MAQSFFRKPVNTEDSPENSPEDQWAPPSYAIPSEHKKEGESWTPPSYAIAENKKKPVQSGFIEGATKSIKEGAKFTKDKINKFMEDTLSEKSSHPYVKRLLTTENPATESALPSTHEMGIKEPTTYAGGFAKGLYDEWVRPLASAAGAAGLMGGEEGIKGEPPIRQSRELPYRMESSIKKIEDKKPIAEKVKSPFPTANKKLLDYMDKNQTADFSKGQVENIPLNKIVGTQPTLTQSVIDEYKTGGKRPEITEAPKRANADNVTAYKVGDKYVLTGGHHRAAADLANGADSIQAVTYPANIPEELLNEESKKSFVNPFEKNKDETLNQIQEAIGDKETSRGIVDEKGVSLAPPQETPTELPIKAPGTEFQAPPAETKTTSEIPIRRDILRDYTGEKFDQDAYDKARERLNMGKDLPEETKKEWVPPSYAQSSEEPQMARTESGKIAIGADVKSLGKVLGTSLYKGDIAPIVTKELLQNSIDAVRHLGTEGKVDVVIDRSNGTIHVMDNGKGLNRQELESVFTDLGSSGKREDTSAAGGFGLAKAAPLLGGEKVEVKSISRDLNGKLHEYSFEGTPNDLLEGVDIKHRIPNENESTGTSVKVFVPKDADFYTSKNFVENLSQHSPNVKSQIRVASRYSNDPSPMRDTEYEKLSNIGGKSITTLNNPSAKTELIEPKSSERKTRNIISLHLSNNGMYQGTKTMYLPYEVPNVPDSITVDIRPKVPEGHADYPFTANREELRGTVEQQVQKYIVENIVKPALGARKDELQRLYNSMQEVTVGKGQGFNPFGRKIAIYDPKGQITSGEMKQITSNPAFHTLAGNIASILDEAMKVAATPEWKARLEKTGIIFEDKLHGIHIPNPGSGKSAILINPFIAIDKMSPDEASANILHTILHEMAHVEPASPSHNESFTVRLGDIYGKFGARRSVEAQDQILKSIADPNTGIYHPEIQEILSTYKKSRGREATTEDLLSGTGIKSESKGGGKEDIPPNDKSNGEGVTSAVNKLFSALEEAKGKVSEQEAINKTERARRFAAFGNVKAEGVKGAAQSLSKLKGEFDKVEPGKELGLEPKEADSLFTAVKNAKITPGEKARGYTALFKILNGESNPVRSELAILDHVFGNGFADRITEMHGGIGAVGLKLTKAANTMKSMQNALSLAAPLRHGIGLVTRKEFYPAFRDMFKFFANKEFYNESMSAIEDHPNYILSRDGGLFIAQPNSLINSEEEFLNSYIGAIPLVRNAVGASNRAYIGFLNKLRFDTFNSMIKQAKSLGNEIETEEGGATKTTESIAKFINNATGRGDLGRLNKMTNELNLLLWSPRMIKSRIDMIANPKIYMDLPKGMRREGLKSLLGIAALGTIINTLASYGGAKVSTNILSTDYGKSRFGTHLIDPWGGFQQYIVGAARFLAGKTDSSMPTSRLDIAGRFLANKESPAASLAHMMLTAKFTGKSSDPKTAGNLTTEYGQKSLVQSELIRRYTPIFVQDLEDLVSTEPDWSENIGLTTALVGASLAGMSQNYPEKKKLGFKKMNLGKLH